MKKRLISIMLAFAMIVGVCFTGCSSNEEKSKQSSQSEKTQPEEEYQIKNIIFLIPDGGGYGPYDFANDVKTAGGFLNDSYANRTPANSKPMTMRSYLAGSIITLNYQGTLTDSAAAGTALATGYKTYNGRIGIDHEGKPVATILEAAQSKGKSTGLVATYEWMHATPASFSAHVMARDDYHNLYQQIENQGVDVVLGSGYGAVSQYASIQNAVDRGYTVVRTREDLENVKPGDKIWGDATNNSSPYDVNLKPEQPTLEQMTKAAITALSGNEKGFFLMVEGSKVDSGGHANDAVVTTSEYIAFDAAFKVAVDFAKERNDTVVIAAPDHDTGAMMYNDIENIITATTKTQFGNNYEGIKWETTSHSTQNVGVWVYLPEGVEMIPGLNPVIGDTPETRTGYVVENTVLAPFLASLIGVDLDELAEELFVDVTDIGRYSDVTGKFTFNNGDKYVYKNQAVYFEKGKEKNLDGKICFEADGRFYVPSCMVTEKDLECVNKEGEGAVSGDGTKESPYIIDKEWKFVEITDAMAAGETYSEKYFLQTCDLDLAGYSGGYSGIGNKAEFAGTYDGGSFKINVKLEGDGDMCLFPVVTGKIMNLGSTGSIKSSDGCTAGIARSVNEGGVIANCYSYVDLKGARAGGIATSNSGIVHNCFFGGKTTATKGEYGIAAGSGDIINCLLYSQDVDLTADELCYKLNDSRQAAANELGVESKELKYWRINSDKDMPELYSPIPVVSGVVIVNDTAALNKGDGMRLSAVVEGQFDPPQDVVWSIEGEVSSSETVLYKDGYLYVAEDEASESITVMAKSAYDGSVTGITTVAVSDIVVTEEDGSRARPYKISTADEFLLFTNAINEGKNLNGLYFVQTADIDMSVMDEYSGIPSNNVFAGNYDGRGFRLNVDFESEGDNSPFGTVSGVLMNVFTTGSVKGVTMPSGVVRKVTHSGIVINCLSDADVVGVDDAAGVARSVYGIAANCYFTGTVLANSVYPCTLIHEGSKSLNNYSIGNEHYVSGDETVISEDELTEECIVKWLNDDRAESAEVSGIEPSLLCEWEYDAENGAVLVRK